MIIRGEIVLTFAAIQSAQLGTVEGSFQTTRD